MRYLKLRISRKLAFAGAIAPLFLVSVRKIKDPREFLTDQYFDLPPLARLAQLVDDLGEDEEARRSLGQTLTVADRFTDFLAGDDRRLVDRIESPEAARNSEVFMAMRDLSAELQGHLERLFLDSEVLGGLGRKYLTF